MGLDTLLHFPTFFFSLIVFGILTISAYEVIRAASLWRRKVLGYLKIGMLIGVILLGLVLFFLGFLPLLGGFANAFFALLLSGGLAFLPIAMLLVFGRKRWKSPAAIVVLALSGYIYALTLAKPKLEWRDGYTLSYELDDGRTHLARELSRGSYVGLILEDVVAVGSDENWIVVEQRNSKSENPQFYILPKNTKERLGKLSLQSLTPEAFEKEVIAKSLPPFSWHKKQTP